MDYQILTQKEEKDTTIWKDNFAVDVLNGLSSTPKRLHSKYIYDDEGSRLFEKIMELPEYYPTDCEFEILHSKKEEFSAVTQGEAFNLVELGAGDGRKTKILLEHFSEKKMKFRYVPIDISEGAIKHLQQRIEGELPGMEIKGIVAEYFHGLRWLKKTSNRRNVVLFMGSNIGNFDPEAGREFLNNVWHSLRNNDLFALGVDLKKDIEIIRNAYNDDQGVTRAFNMNLLTRINRELEGNFNPDQFDFYSTYNPFSGAVESFLISLKDQEVKISALEKTFSFSRWEPIHTEYSFKYALPYLQELAESSGFKVVKQLFDSKGYFCDSIWKVVK